MSRNLGLLVLCGLLQFPGAGQSAADESPLPNADYGVSTIWQVGGTGSWDYLALEPSGARLFVSRSDRVDVIETASGHRAATIPSAGGVRGIAFAPEFKRGYTSNGRSNTVSAFELDTLRIVQEAPVAGKKPDAILYEPLAQRVLTADEASNDISVLDPTSLQLLGSIALPGPPGFMVTDDAGTVFVNIDLELAKVVAVDPKALKIKATWPLPGCANPTGLALDAAHHRLFSVCGNGILVVTDSLSGRQVARVGIGAGPDAAAYDGDLGFVFSSNGTDGTLTVIHQDTPDTYRVIASVQTQKSAKTMVLDPATHRLYLASAHLGPAPAPTPEEPHPRPAVLPDTFVILVAEPK